MHYRAFLIACLVGVSATACVGEEEVAEQGDNYVSQKPKRSAPDQISAADNWKLWQEYCVGDQDVTRRPTPNYDNPVVMEAAKQLSRVAAHSFSLYSDISSHHKTDVPAELEGTVSKMAHEFLGYTCGEFRDRATMVETKIRWVAEMNYLDDEPGPEYDPSGDPWKQMKQSDYKPYLALSSALWTARQSRLANEGRRYMKVGERQVDTPVPAQTICETKYMFASYVKAGKSFDNLEAFDAGYPAFAEAYCNLPDDEAWYYDFRGDSNIKPNSPESNGMIWFSRTMAKQCDARASAPPYQKARTESANVTDADCQRYYKYPFTERWNAARAGLASWVLVDPYGDALDSNSTFTVFPRWIGDETYLFGDKGPYRAKNDLGDIPLLDGYAWKYGAFGLPEMHGNDKQKIHTLIQLAVDRHTDWYDSGYDDLMEWKAYKRDQAYSPFVASSYEMSKSDHFVTPGTTVPVIDPSSKNHKHWMFVFKVRKEYWYTPERINAEDVPVPNFDRYWFDETSFGESGLANSERAWDRLGTTLEEEHAALLYLHNLPAY